MARFVEPRRVCLTCLHTLMCVRGTSKFTREHDHEYISKIYDWGEVDPLFHSTLFLQMVSASKCWAADRPFAIAVWKKARIVHRVHNAGETYALLVLHRHMIVPALTSFKDSSPLMDMLLCILFVSFKLLLYSKVNLKMVIESRI